MPQDQIFMGTAIALASGWGMKETAWLVTETRKGQWLARKAGVRRAGWILRGMFFLGIVLGVGLATDLIRPLNAVGF